MNELGRELELLGGHIRYPATPGLAEAVGRRIESPRQGVAPTWRGSPPRALAIAILVALLLASAAVAARAARALAPQPGIVWSRGAIGRWRPAEGKKSAHRRCELFRRRQD